MFLKEEIEKDISKGIKNMANREIEIEYDGLTYKLGYSRATIRQMERAGFNINKIDESPVTYIPMLFEGAFLLHHKKVKQEKVNEIFKNLENKEDLLPELGKIYMESMSTLMDEPDENSAKKASWKIV